MHTTSGKNSHACILQVGRTAMHTTSGKNSHVYYMNKVNGCVCLTFFHVIIPALAHNYTLLFGTAIPVCRLNSVLGRLSWPAGKGSTTHTLCGSTKLESNTTSGVHTKGERPGIFPPKSFQDSPRGRTSSTSVPDFKVLPSPPFQAQNPV